MIRKLFTAGTASVLLLAVSTEAVAQRGMEPGSDPRPKLEKDWGPLPAPPGARYDQQCSEQTGTAVFFLGLEVPADAQTKAAERAEQMREENARARGAGQKEPHDFPTVMMQTELILAGGTTEGMELVGKTVDFLKKRGMIVVNGSRGEALLQYPSNSAKAEQIGYTLSAYIAGGGKMSVSPGIMACSWLPSGPTVAFAPR